MLRPYRSSIHTHAVNAKCLEYVTNRAADAYLYEPSTKKQKGDTADLSELSALYDSVTDHGKREQLSKSDLKLFAVLSQAQR